MIRVVTLNIWQEQGPWERRLELIAERLAALRPDVVCLQEVRQVPETIPNQAETLARRLGLAHAYETAQPWGGGDEGLAILSRLGLEESVHHELPSAEGRSRRIGLGARLRTPRGAVWVFTTHLAWRMEDGHLRERQVLALDRFIRETAGDRLTMLAGDFNATPEADEVRFLRGLTTLEGRRTYFQDAFQRCNPGARGATWTRENPYTARLGWLEPERRLDYIFVSGERRDGRGRVLAGRIVCDTPDPRGVYCSDHYGVLAEIGLGEG